ncbi:hypothetical protein PO124_12880 [Bacillus licheniformis]|nr:hypothetical protein [Bacillus licheniformis]
MLISTFGYLVYVVVVRLLMSAAGRLFSSGCRHGCRRFDLDIQA